MNAARHPGTQEAPSPRAEAILAAVMPVFGRYGFKKTSVDDLAAAAGLSKQGLYLHFASKEELFLQATRHYLDVGLALVDQALAREGAALQDRIVDAMDAWFGRHLVTYSPEALDVIAAGDQLAGDAVDGYKAGFRDRLARALRQSPGFIDRSTVTAEELAAVLFTFGLTWKEGRKSRAEFVAQMRLCVRACLPAPRKAARAAASKGVA